MKKLLTIILSSTLILTLVSCGSNEDNNKKTASSGKNSVSFEDNTEGSSTSPKKEKKKIEPDVKVEDLEFQFQVNKGEYGNITMKSSYKNNSKFSTTRIKLVYLNKATNKKDYIFSEDTVLPGETSPEIKNYLDETLAESDMQFLNISYEYVDGDNNKIKVSYDYKLEAYEIHEY